jgi:hypothetical protein
VARLRLEGGILEEAEYYREPSQDFIQSGESSEDLIQRSGTVNERNNLSGHQSESVEDQDGNSTIEEVR